jgi:hypothetical protein
MIWPATRCARVHFLSSVVEWDSNALGLNRIEVRHVMAIA